MNKYTELSRIEVFLLTVVFCFVFFGWYFSLSFREYFEAVYTVEDGLVEWLTVLFLLMGAAVSFGRFWRLRDVRPPLFRACCLALGLVFIFGAGEEISWGQRLLGIQSPAFFLKYNSQGETNLHNLVFGDFRVNKTIFGLFLGIFVAAYVIILPALYRRMQTIRCWVNQLALPLPRLIHMAFYLLLFVVVSLVPSGKRGELLEFGGCALFFLIILSPVNRSIFVKKRPFVPGELDAQRI